MFEDNPKKIYWLTTDGLHGEEPVENSDYKRYPDIRRRMDKNGFSVEGSTLFFKASSDAIAKSLFDFADYIVQSTMSQTRNKLMTKFHNFLVDK